MKHTPIFEHNPLTYQEFLQVTIRFTDDTPEYSIWSVQGVPLFGLYTKQSDAERLWHIQPMLPVQSSRARRKYKTMDEAMTVMLGVLYDEYHDKPPIWDVLSQGMTMEEAKALSTTVKALSGIGEYADDDDIRMPKSTIKIDG